MEALALENDEFHVTNRTSTSLPFSLCYGPIFYPPSLYLTPFFSLSSPSFSYASFATSILCVLILEFSYSSYYLQNQYTCLLLLFMFSKVSTLQQYTNHYTNTPIQSINQSINQSRITHHLHSHYHHQH